jgi:predicted metal-binding membrane protein
MMAAMMFPSVAPTIALYARMSRRRAPTAPLLFAAGYLLAWTAAGLLAYGLTELGRAALADAAAWNHAGRWIAGGTLLVAAGYELTPLKDVCLTKCRSPLGFLLGAWRDGLRGAVIMGTRHGAWCVGCCWALMASLFALGVMSLIWMALVTALIALEKTVTRGGRATVYATALILLVLGVVVLASPDAVPGLTIPGGTPDAGAMPMR